MIMKGKSNLFFFNSAIGELHSIYIDYNITYKCSKGLLFTIYLAFLPYGYGDGKSSN